MWTTDLSMDNGNYEKTLYFAKSDLNHLDVVISAEPTETGNYSNDTDVVPEQIETGPDDDVIITKVVESSLDEVEFLGRKGMKIESDNSNSDSEISLEKIRSDVLSSFMKNKKRRLEGPVKHTSSGKIYVEEMYWQDTSINQTNQLSFDFDGNCIFEAPINTEKCVDSTKGGRHWGPLRESKRSGLSGDRYIATCRGSFECHNKNCPYLIEFKKVN